MDTELSSIPVAWIDNSKRCPNPLTEIQSNTRIHPRKVDETFVSKTERKLRESDPFFDTFQRSTEWNERCFKKTPHRLVIRDAPPNYETIDRGGDSWYFSISVGRQKNVERLTSGRGRELRKLRGRISGKGERRLTLLILRGRVSTYVPQDSSKRSRPLSYLPLSPPRRAHQRASLRIQRVHGLSRSGEKLWRL